MREMRAIAIDDPSVCQSVTRASRAKAAERIGFLLRAETPRDPRNILFDGSPDFPRNSMRLSPNYFDQMHGGNEADVKEETLRQLL